MYIIGLHYHFTECCLKPEAHWGLGSVGRWLQPENRTWPISQACKRDEEQSKGWGSAQAPRPPNWSLFLEPPFLEKLVSWELRRLPKPQPSPSLLHPKQSAPRHQERQQFYSFPRHFNHLKDNEIMPIFRGKINYFDSCLVDLTNN